MKELETAFGKSLAENFSSEIQSSGFEVVDDLYARRVYSKDLWPRNLILDREASLPNDANIDAVVRPVEVGQISKLLKLANEMNWVVIPYGAGSSVCGSASAPSRSSAPKRPTLVLDLKKMDRIEALDEVSMVAKVQAGILGQVLEENLNARGFTMGHFPSSIYCSSFGGYLATRAAGQLSTHYGKIEDMVLSVEGVLPTGEIFATPLAPRLAVGPDWNHVFVGSEGTLGVLTSAWVKVHRSPQDRKFLGFHVASTPDALDGVRKWLQAGLRPAAVRIYDEEESKLLHGYKSGVKLIVVVEGDFPYVDFTMRELDKMASQLSGWENLGADPAEEWWAKRYDISYRQQQILSHRRMILDTFEVSTTWSKLPQLHLAVKAAAKKVSEGGLLVLLAHFSHFYHSGGNIYFTLCGRNPDEEGTEVFYDQVWNALLEACQEQGAAISHHHGIGRLKVAAFVRSHGVLYEALRKFKNELDPRRILNPENLGL